LFNYFWVTKELYLVKGSNLLISGDKETFNQTPQLSANKESDESDDDEDNDLFEFLEGNEDLGNVVNKENLAKWKAVEKLLVTQLVYLIRAVGRTEHKFFSNAFFQPQ
jgi:hypothetical protein